MKEKNLSHSPPNYTSIILESISDGVFTVDKNWRITSFNRAAEEITGIPRKEAIGQLCSDIFHASMCEVDCALNQTMKSGAPVINKSAFFIDVNGRRVPISVSTALLRDENGEIIGGAETFRDLSLVEELRKELSGQFYLGDLVSRSDSMRKIFKILPQIANSDSTVLLYGETGTGKELIAKAIHNLSSRKDKPFIAVNCGALPDTLLESELFGYQAGAFTGADKNKPGRFALAEDGTLLLDEIGEVSQALQVRLLRVLQEKVFEPLGATKSVQTNIRVIAATNQNLADLIEKGSFRKDLYYRINVIKIELPPLKERKEDIPLLIEHFIKQFNRRQSKSITGVSPHVLTFLMSYDYPGNIRELENLIEHAFVLCTDSIIEIDHLPDDYIAHPKASQIQGEFNAIIKSVETQTIVESLKRNNNNRLAAARELGLHKTTLYRKMKALGITLSKPDGRSQKK
jgi:PAS domain S-box-containing protein